MHKVDAAGHSSNQFVDGNPAGGIAGTLLEKDWHNAVQGELVYSIETKAGITLVKGTNTQLGAALDMIMLGIPPGGRLTLESGVGVSTSDQAGKTTVYYAPHKHNRIAVYDGTQWVWRSFTELSQATTDNTKSPAAVANNSNYDVFAWLDSGTLRATRGPAWSSDTARGTGAGTSELEFFEGKWVNKNAVTNGPAARRGLYVGSIRSDGSAQINDVRTGTPKIHLWNMYHRVARPLVRVDTTNTWAYSTATYRQANAAAANQLDILIGLAEDPVTALVRAVGYSDTGGDTLAAGIGVDSTSANSAQVLGSVESAINGGKVSPVAEYAGYPGIGRHTLVWLELAAAGGNVTWVGDENVAYVQSGITGRVWA